MKPKRRLVAVSEPFEPIQFLARLLAHPHESVRIAAVAGLARHEATPAARLFLKVAEGDVCSDVRLAAKRALDGNTP